MTPDKKILLERIAESRDLLINNDISIPEALSALNEYKAGTASLIDAQQGVETYSSVKSLLAVFNINNFAELTVVLFIDKTGYKVIDFASDEFLFRSFQDLMIEDSGFYNGVEKIRIHGRNMQVFHESMDIEDLTCRIITFTESSLFRATSFHILCDIIMDVVKLVKYKPAETYYDFFENISVDINRYISKMQVAETGTAYFFTFGKIIHFFKNTAFSHILELSSEMESRLTSIFGNKPGIFRISLSRFLVITDGDEESEKNFRKCRERKVDFIFRGIVLPYTCSALIFEKERNAYSILEKILKTDI